ncbi:MAG TPA: AIR synthase-related protein, partial [Gammaproteobacteria bacterium]|nr:AIR synthase-related protein [Gammaproteobacteria bacterium]
AVRVHGMAHITGGGLSENLPRVIPDGLEALINPHAWERPAVFDWLQRAGTIENDEMYRTFNCGIGMTITVGAEYLATALDILRAAGEVPVVIGEVRRGNGGVVLLG